MTQLLNLDYHKFAAAVKRLSSVPLQPGVDVFTEAAREAAEQPNLVLTPEQRRQCKQAAYHIIYGASGESFIEALRRDQA